VVVGEAGAEKASATLQGGPAAYKGAVAARAIDVHSGRVVAVIQEQAVSVAADEITGSQNAIATAGRQAGRILAQRLATIEKAAPGGSRAFTVVVKAIQPMARFVRFRQALAALAGVEAVQAREMTANQATLQVRFGGTIRDLEAAVRQHPFDGFRVQVVEVAGDRIELELTGDGHLP
jgi:hypothetical protein